jgi:tetratricopeptide (TPR) repeat protein
MREFFILIFGVMLCNQVLSAQTFEELVIKSYEYTDANDLPAAEEHLKAAMRLEPANQLNFALLTNLGTIQRRQGKLEDALISYSAALSQRPKDEVILLNRAKLYSEMGEMEKAIFDYTILIDIFPTHEEGLFNRGLLYINTGQFILAETDFDFILNTYKDTFLGRFGHAILEKARGSYDDSEIIFNYLAEKYPDNIRILEERAELYFLTKRNGRAMADLNKVFTATPEPSAELYMLRGRVKLAQHEKESAAIDFKKAHELGYDTETVEKLIKESF